MGQRVFFFDLMRCLAAIAVIAIHVLAPYRHELGSIPFEQWITAITVNSFSRWAVPVFILITGALMLNDNRPFDMKYYIKRRLAKVVIPFILWSLFYAFLSGWTLDGFNFGSVENKLQNSLHNATYYHLGFFYYFIPLYLMIPFFQLLVRNDNDTVLYLLVVFWLFTATLFLFGIDGFWSNQLWLYSGYLPLGYVLYKKIPLCRLYLLGLTLLGAFALVMTTYMVTNLSLDAGIYTVGRWLSYKTINTIIVASMIFVICRYVGDSLPQKTKTVVVFISQHSLGVYLLHPLFLWPMKALYGYQGHPGWVIPIWVLLSGAGALLLSWRISSSEKTRWLLP